ncbi:NB-ARC domain-containing protein [Nodularia spumigena CS-586/05]|uniref:NB-ARC domain-containing protein n=1 Tax=Nodularia spumigena TaxID=70799 RepID=UPI00232F5617|nr:NB-ARC domain-containing protein [Nodularia spumigena]MDB9371021.1 NB-ARC domain-containing protein [Nodularia spumigena CS-586/05]
MGYSASSQENLLIQSCNIQSSYQYTEDDDLQTLTLEEALSVLNELVSKARGKPLSEPEITVVRGAWNGQNYEKMSENSSYSQNYLQRRVATILFDTLTEIIGNGEQVCKRNLRTCLEAFMSQDAIYGSQIPDVSSFYGREAELILLKELIKKQHCVSLVGVAGIGKSSLAAKLITDISTNKILGFDYLIWKSVAHIPPIEDLVTELLEILDPEFVQPHHTQASITHLLKYLQKKRCLIVLDDLELLGQNFEQKLDYLFFIRRVVEETHQSCLILTSRVLLDEFDDLLNAKRPFQFIKLEGLDTNASMQFLFDRGLTDPKKCHQLIQTYRGNPSELAAVIDRIYHLFGSTEIFFENPTTLVSKKLENILNEIVGQVLQNIHKQILIYLAEKVVGGSELISITTILNNFKRKNTISTLDVVKALEILEKMSLIETVKNPVTQEISFTLQPVIKKYVTTDTRNLINDSNPSNLKMAS